MSPLTATNKKERSTSSSQVSKSGDESVVSQVLRSDLGSVVTSSELDRQMVPKPEKLKASTDFQCALTGGVQNGKSAEQAYRDMSIQQLHNDTHSLAVKIGTTVLEKADNIPQFLEHLDSSHKIADELCHFFGCDGIVSGRQLREGVSKGRVGQSPPRRGRKSSIPEDEFEALAMLLFTASSIQQANCDADRFERPELISIVGQILNDKLRSDGLPEMDDAAFFKRLEKKNALMANVNILDK